MMMLHIHHMKDSFFALPSDKQAELMAGVMAFAEKFLKNGKMKACYEFFDGKGSATIWDNASAEEIMRIYLDYPVNSYIESKIIPVVEFEAAAKIMKEMMGAAQRATKK